MVLVGHQVVAGTRRKYCSLDLKSGVLNVSVDSERFSDFQSLTVQSLLVPTHLYTF